MGKSIRIMVFLVLSAVFGAAQTPMGDQFQVAPAGDLGDAGHPDIGMSRNGDFVVVWQATELDVSTRLCTFARWYTPHGEPKGPAVLVNSGTQFSARGPKVAVTHTGEAIVVWAGGTTEGLVHFQRFDATGAVVGSETEVSDIRIGLFPQPLDVAVDQTGKFVVVWDTAFSPGTDDDSYAIVAQRFDASGASVGDVFQVNDYIIGSQLRPRVAMDDVGNFVVTWTSVGSPGTDQSSTSIQARWIDFHYPDLSPSQFQVNEVTAGQQEDSSVTMARTGEFVVTWSGEVDGGDWGILARGYDIDHLPIGSEYRVDAWPWGYFTQQYTPVAQLTEVGDLYLAWFTHGTLNGDDPLDSIAARHFYPDLPPGDQFQVNNVTDGYQQDPQIASNAGGAYVVTWQDGNGIHARRFGPRHLLFFGDFESGDFEDWSYAVP